MGKKIMRLPLAELKTIRITCVNETCGAVVELSLEQLGSHRYPKQCPLCSNSFGVFPPGASTAKNGFEPFAIAITNLLSSQNNFKIEFAIPSDDSATQS